jgi:hypothetical protein
LKLPDTIEGCHELIKQLLEVVEVAEGPLWLHTAATAISARCAQPNMVTQNLLAAATTVAAVFAAFTARLGQREAVCTEQLHQPVDATDLGETKQKQQKKEQRITNSNQQQRING